MNKAMKDWKLLRRQAFLYKAYTLMESALIIMEWAS